MVGDLTHMNDQIPPRFAITPKLRLFSCTIIIKKGYVVLTMYGRVALVLRTNRVIECNVKCLHFTLQCITLFVLNTSATRPYVVNTT